MVDARLIPAVICMIAEAAASVRAWRLRTYPWFMAYCVVTLIQDGALWATWPPSSIAYKDAWFLGGCLRLGLQIAMLAEAARLLRKRYPDIDDIAPKLAMTAAVLGLTFGTLGSVDLLRPIPNAFYVLWIFLRFAGSAFTVLAVWLALWGWFFSGEIRTNLQRHAFLLSFYFLSSTVFSVLTWKHLDHYAVYGSAALFLAWTWTMRPDGEIAQELPQWSANGGSGLAGKIVHLTGDLARRADSSH